MKRHGDLYDSISSIENLRLAEKKARKNKTHQAGVKVFDKSPETNLFILHEMLLNKSFKTSNYTIFKVHDPKEREVYRLPYFPDRITQHAIMNKLERIFVSSFTADTYSCVKGRGPHSASLNLRKALRDKMATRYCLKIDIKKFYPSVDHEVLKQILRRKIKDKDLLSLLDEIIDSAEGLPIGNYLSQYFANFYMTYFDHWIKEVKRVRYFFRYSDDMVVLSDNKPYLHQLLSEIRKYLDVNLKLSVKDNYQVFPVEARGIDFVGYVHYHDCVFLRKSIKQSFARAVSSGSGRSSVASYFGWAKHCNSKNLLKKLLMKNFSDLLLPTPKQGMEGDKIDLYQIMGETVAVLSYSIGPSKFKDKGNGKCLCLQIEYEGKKRIVFTGSGSLMNVIETVPKESFPFKTKIVKENKRYLFT